MEAAADLISMYMDDDSLEKFANVSKTCSRAATQEAEQRKKRLIGSPRSVFVQLKALREAAVDRAESLAAIYYGFTDEDESPRDDKKAPNEEEALEILDGGLLDVKHAVTLPICNGREGNNKEIMNIMHWAARAGHKKVLKRLVSEFGVDVDQPSTGEGGSESDSSINSGFTYDENGRTALMMAFRAGNNDGDFLSAKMLLLELNADPTRVSDQKNTALHRAAFVRPGSASGVENLYECMQNMVARGADIDAVNQFIDTPLWCATQIACLKTMKMLLDLGANPNFRIKVTAWTRNRCGWTPLHQVASYDNECPPDDHIEIIKLMGRYGADINACNEENQTPLDRAYKCHQDGDVIEAMRDLGFKRSRDL